MKKKIIASLLTLTLSLSLLAACGKEKGKDEGDKETTTVSSADKEAGQTTTEKADEPETLATTAQAQKSAFFTAFETETIDGEKVTDEIFKGNKVTMVNVWGTFCSPCIREMPALQQLSEAYKDKGVRIIGVLCDTFDIYKEENIPEKVQDAKDIIAQTGVEYTNLLPSVSLNKAKLDYVFSVPTTYFLNEKGEIIGSEFVGSKSYDQWSAILDGVLENA